jgi:hypothetical protein
MNEGSWPVKPYARTAKRRRNRNITQKLPELRPKATADCAQTTDNEITFEGNTTGALMAREYAASSTCCENQGAMHLRHV